MTAQEEDLNNILESVLEEQFSSKIVEDCSDSSDLEVDDKKVVEIPKDFAKLISDFINDVSTTFPEYKAIIEKWWSFDSYTGEQLANLFSHCMKVYPPRFTDIIYQKEEIFQPTSSENVDFLPELVLNTYGHVMISVILIEIDMEISQTITICVVGSIDTDNMDKTMKEVFDKLDEDTFKDNLCETIDQIQGIFQKATNDVNEDEDSSDTPNISADAFQENLTI